MRGIVRVERDHFAADIARSACQSAAQPRQRLVRIGNLISPLTLYGDATQPLEDLAKELKQQMSKAMRQRTHLALPSLSSPAKFLPWEVFRKLAANPELTGFATSHFAWFEQSQTIHEEVSRISDGALQIVESTDLHAGLPAHGRCDRDSRVARTHTDFS